MGCLLIHTLHIQRIVLATTEENTRRINIRLIIAVVHGTGLPNPSPETKFSQARRKGTGKYSFSLFSFTTSRIGNTLSYPIDSYSCNVVMTTYYIHTRYTHTQHKHAPQYWNKIQGYHATVCSSVVVVVVVVSHIQRIGCQPEKTTLHGGQSRSWSAEQGKENKIKSLAAYPPPPPPTLLVRRK